MSGTGSRSVVVVWNAKAGGARKAAALRSRLEALAGVRVEPASTRDASVRAAREAAAAGADLVVAAGGDGTVNAVVEGLLAEGARPALAVLPVGTANDFRRTLGVPDDLDQALDLALSGSTRPLDVLRVTADGREHLAVNVVTAGNGARVTRRVTSEVKARWGPLAYLRQAVDVLGDLQRHEVVLSVDEAPAERLTALTMIAANGCWSAGGLAVAPHADMADGLVDLVVIPDAAPSELAALTARLLFADYIHSERVLWRRGRRVRVESHPPLPVAVDGDVIGRAARLDIEVLPAALRVVGAPPS